VAKEDGRSWKVRLDYGLGFLCPRQRTRFPFDHDADRQSVDLLAQRYEVGNVGKFPALLCLSDVK
jgi:hypothetical protein